MERKDKSLSRRELLMSAGLAGAGPQAPPIRIRTVDRPTLGETNADFKRFSGATAPSLYNKIRTERDGADSLKAERAENARRAADLARQGRPGFGVRDRQLTQAAWTLARSTTPGAGLLSWTCITARTSAAQGTEPWVASPLEMAQTVKAAARLYGAAMTGIAPMTETYVNLRESGRDVVFDDVGVPAVTAEKFVIPRKMKWVVAIAVPSNLDLLAWAPSALGEAATALGYSQCLLLVASLAEFIRGLGYEAIPSLSDTAQCVPFAVQAGLGELGRMNRLVTPELGPAVRLCKVFTDMPMPYDKPIDFGLIGFCKRCQSCAQACPARALSFDAEPSFRTTGPWNNAGHKAWFEDAYLCWQYSQKVGANVCSKCLVACPYTRAAKRWQRESGKAASARAPAGGRGFRILVDGAGRERGAEEWWAQEPPSGGSG
ncbi:MAG: reductive dehalogenase [Bryobacterales bacterium]|nr:reductive dehalogenase [Bryobacterales bacterium]